MLRECLMTLVLIPLSTEQSGRISTMLNASVFHASGTFDVKIAPTDHAPDPTLASHSLNKQYRGDLEATAKGEMLSAGDPTNGNAGYVAIERVSGTLAGKTGTFALMQSGTMMSGSAPQLSVIVVPGSGTGDLAGINGKMTIVITNGKHSYVLDYSIGRTIEK